MTSLFRSKNEVVYDLIRDDILKGNYRPGSRLVIDELAAKLGISQIPIREAMRQLEADGFVKIEPYVGATVTEFDADFIYEVFALLEAMEVICSRSACRLMSDEDMEHLAKIVNDMEASVEDPDQWSKQNKEMHLFVCQAAHTELVLKMMRKVLDHWDRLRLHYLTDVFSNRIKAAQAEHHQILQAFYSRDPDEVERVVHEHNQKALASYISHLQAAGELETTEDSET